MSMAIPISLDSADPVGAAIRLRAARAGVSPEEIVHSILRRALAPEIEEMTGTPPLAAVIQQVMQANARGG